MKQPVVDFVIVIDELKRKARLDSLLFQEKPTHLTAQSVGISFHRTIQIATLSLAMKNIKVL